MVSDLKEQSVLLEHTLRKVPLPSGRCPVFPHGIADAANCMSESRKEMSVVSGVDWPGQEVSLIFQRP